MLDFGIDSINRRFIVHKKFDATHQKIDQKVNVFKSFLKVIKEELFLFDEYHKVILFLTKLILILKNKFFIIRDVLNIKKTILFKIIIQICQARSLFDCIMKVDFRRLIVDER